MPNDDIERILEFRLVHSSGTNLVVDNDGNVQINTTLGKNIFVGNGTDQFLIIGDELKTWIENTIGEFV
jgi:hypothetical protein